jgi:hypothetical protein
MDSNAFPGQDSENGEMVHESEVGLPVFKIFPKTTDESTLQTYLKVLN